MKKKKCYTHILIKEILLVALAISYTAFSYASTQLDYTTTDSLFACKILKSNPGNPADVGRYFLGLPYVAHTLEVNNYEQLVTNLHEIDCTTFIENSLALYIARGKEFSDFRFTLQNLRYFNGRIRSYSSRKHYMTMWILDNITHSNLIDETQTHGTAILYTRLNYMSTHPDNYKQLRNNKFAVAEMHQIEETYSGIEVRYLAKKDLKCKGAPWIHEGDVICLVTSIPGLDISHLGIATYKNGILHLMHASSIAKKVIIDPRPLSKQISNKSYLGIRVLRIK